MKLEVVSDELPYRVEFDGLLGASKSPSGAVVVALSAGHRIPLDKRDPSAVASYLFWNYEANPDWVKLIHILENDTFDPYVCPECGQYKPDDERVQSGMKCGQCAGYGRLKE